MRWAALLPATPDSLVLPVGRAQQLPPFWPWVEVVTSHAGVRPQVIDGLLAAGVQGLVVAGTGNGRYMPPAACAAAGP